MNTFHGLRGTWKLVGLLVGLLALVGIALLVAAPRLTLGVLPFLVTLALVLACPLMMVFMHGGRGHGDHAGHMGHGPERSDLPTDGRLSRDEPERFEHAPVVDADERPVTR